jgi:uncharacterized protein YjbI with pentapeptide repeats
MKAEDLLKLYKEGRRNFSGVDLSGMCFDNQDLSEINLEGANLSNTKWCEINLANANLQNTDLRGVEIIGELFGNNIDFSGANFEGTRMEEGIIEKANFSRANFRNTSFSQFSMNECNCSDVDFTNAWFRETYFGGSNFRGAIFHKAVIIDGGCFWDVDIAEADFSCALFRFSPRHLTRTRDTNTDANFINAVFFVPQSSSPEDLDTSGIQGAICVRTMSEMNNLNLDEYNSSAVRDIVQYMLESSAPT